MSNNGATLEVSALSAIGVRTIFTLSGNQIMSIFDACIEFTGKNSVSAGVATSFSINGLRT